VPGAEPLVLFRSVPQQGIEGGEAVSCCPDAVDDLWEGVGVEGGAVIGIRSNVHEDDLTGLQPCLDAVGHRLDARAGCLSNQGYPRSTSPPHSQARLATRCPAAAICAAPCGPARELSVPFPWPFRSGTLGPALRRVGHQNGAVGMGDEGGADGAQEQAAESTVPAASHDDHVGVPAGVDQCLPGMAPDEG